MDAVGANGFIRGSESGGGGDGVGEWPRVIGLAVRGGESKSEKSWLSFQFISSIFSSTSPLVGSASSGWGVGSVGVIIVVRCPTASASLSGFLSKNEFKVTKMFSS